MQKKNEKISEFAESVERLYNIAFPGKLGEGDGTKIILVEAHIDGLLWATREVLIIVQ